jgi:hypothetical protein
MTEQEKQALLDQLKSIDIFTMMPQYRELPKSDKEKVLLAFEEIFKKEKIRLENE